MAERGRPSIFTPELAAAICARLEAGESLRSIGRDDAMPSKTAILDWAANNKEFADQYAHARARGWDARAEAAVEDAKMAEDAAKGRLAFDAERWYLGKMAPKKYGDKLDMTVDATVRGSVNYKANIPQRG